MKIAVFGATGGTGRSLVTQALDQGHEVVALVRRADALDDAHPRLSTVQGDALDPEAVARTVEGADAVACVLGLAKPQGDVVSRATAVICEAMRAAGVPRLVAVTVMGLGESRNSFTPAGKLLVRLFMQKALEDRERQEAVIRDSGLDYVLVRPTRLVDGSPTGRYSAGPDVRAGITAKVPRGDVAKLVLEQLEAAPPQVRELSVVGS